MAGYISVPDAEIKEPVYPGPATPEQLNRGVSFAEKDESLMIKIYQSQVIHLPIDHITNSQT